MIFSGGGGSNPLNFKVVGGTTAPANPKENTIWANTDTAISSWAFSATQPDAPAEGMVWITTGAASPNAFNALKKNTLHVYPTTLHQHIGGVWIFKTAKVYKDGVWNEIMDLAPYFFKSGIGWVADFEATLLANCTMDSEGIHIPGGGSGRHGLISKNKITVTGVNTLYVRLKHNGYIGDANNGFYIGLSNETTIEWPSQYWTSYVKVRDNYQDWTDVKLSIPGGIGSKYLKMFSYMANEVEISDIWVE